MSQIHGISLLTTKMSADIYTINTPSPVVSAHTVSKLFSQISSMGKRKWYVILRPSTKIAHNYEK
jgi:hypothetical protein